MTKNEFIKECIDKCDDAYVKKNLPLAKETEEYIISAFSQDKLNIGEHLYNTGSSYDYIEDMRLVRGILYNYICNLEREEENKKYEIEKLQLQKSITIQNTLSATATSTVTITIEQTISNILSIPKEDLPDEEKKKLVAELTDLEFAKGNEPTLKEKISNILKNIADKGFEVGKAVLPLVLEYMKNS